jgi:hypothetical protein
LVVAGPFLLQAQTPDSTHRDGARVVPMTSGAHLTRAHLDSLPIDDPASAFAQIPGVFLRGGDVGLLPSASLSIRGGVANSAATYVDGAPVRSFTTGSPFLTPALNGISSLDVTTGLAGVELFDVQNGLVEYHTPAGTEHLQTHWTAHTDNPFGSVASVGYNRFAGDVSGPLGMPGLTFFASGTVQGQSSRYLGFGAQNVPVYEVDGLDTAVLVNTGSGNASVAIPKFVSFGQGISRPFDWTTQAQFQGKVQWAYGAGSMIAISGFAGGLQERNTPGVDLGDPALFSGGHEWTRLAVLNWHQRITDALAFEAVMSLGSDYLLSGALDPASETATRDPSLGIELSSLNFSSFGSIGVPLDEQIIKNIRTNSGLRVPLLNQTQFRNAQPYRMNPYAMQSGGFYTTGVDAPLALSSERRRTGRWELHWKAPGQRQYVTVGADADGADLTHYSAGSPISQNALDAWTASPRRTGIFFQDVISLGAVTVEAGVRHDRVNPGALLPIVPGFTFSNPNWDQTLNSTSPDGQYEAAVARVFQPTADQSFVTPRVRVSWVIDDATSVRAAFGQTLMMPPVGLVAAGSNADLTFTNANDFFGRDVTDGKASDVEGGIRRWLDAGTSVDLSGYYYFHIPSFGERITNFDDPTNPGRQLTINVLGRNNNAYLWGFDVGVAHQIGRVVAASVSYGFNKNGFEDVQPIIVPFPGSPPTVLNVPGAVTNHELAAALHATVPDDWAREGWRSALKNVAAVVQFRMINGIPYTPLQNIGAGTTAPGFNFGLSATQAGDINSERLPWTKVLDLRLTKGIRLNGMDWTVFADFRNLFNFKNLYSLYAETNDTANSVFLHNTIAGEFVDLANEANSNGALNADGSVTLGNCAAWKGQAGPVDCVMLQRAEARFGNGDGVYTQAEQTKAFTTYYDLVYGASRFYGPQRTVRVGLSLAL